MNNLWLFIITDLCCLLSTTAAQCPTIASGRCFVDCTVPSVYNIACEDIKGQQLYDDLRYYEKSVQPIQLAVWNSPMNRIGTAILSSVKDALLKLELDNIVNLEHFPELHSQTKMRELIIMNSPLLDDMPLELLPPGLQRLILFRTGITSFINDFEEKNSIPSLEDFIFIRGRIDEIQPRYFTAFPNLTSVQIMRSHFALREAEEGIFTTKKPLSLIRIAHNSFEPSAIIIAKNGVLNDATYKADATVDFTNNSFPITADTMLSFGKFAKAKTISFRGNKIDSYVSTYQGFIYFDNLETLDLRDTDFLKERKSFAGLPQLKMLHLGGNNFNDLTTVRIFEGSLSNLTYLDLSRNRLRFLPIGMEPIGPHLTELDLMGNQLDMASIFRDNQDSYITRFNAFPRLKKLDLSDNGLDNFRGIWVRDLKSLYQLNIGGNQFDAVDSAYFKDMPDTLRILNLTFGRIQDSMRRARFQPDAFAYLPPITTLILQKGLLDSMIFTIFKRAAISKLRHLDLGYNDIGILTQEMLKPLGGLHGLRLNNNRLQSCGHKALQSLVNLRDLDLSFNKITLISSTAFVGLANVKVLTLTGNGLTEIQPGALDPLIKMENLYLGNNRLTDFVTLFNNAGKQLIHLGLQDNPIDCIPDGFLVKMRTVKWIYLNSSRAVNLDLGSFRRLGSTMSTYPFRLWAFREPLLSDIGCESWEDWATAYRRSWRFVIKDQMDTVLQNILINFPNCHMEQPRRIQYYVENLICPPP